MSPSGQHVKDQGWWAVREIDHLFGRFRRYTRFVVYSKWSLLIVAMVLVASLIAWPFISKDKSGLRVSFVDKKSVQAAPESPVMSKPVYTGSSASGQQYKVIGVRAVQVSQTHITLEDVTAEMTRPNGAIYTLAAKRAEYYQDKKRIELMGEVTVHDPKASTFITERATIETDTMHIFGNDPIRGDGPTGKLTASGFDISEKGNHITFIGGAQQLTVTIDRKKP